LIDMLPDLDGTVLTADALHTIMVNCERIVVEKKGDFLFAVKGNTPELKQSIEKALDRKGAPVERAETLDCEHGRIEARTIEVVPTPPGNTGWPNTFAACRVTRDAEHMRRGEVVKTTHEQALYVGSFATTTYSPEEILGLTRGHWAGIENGLHHPKDRSMDEDRNRASAKGIGRVMSCLRSWSALILRRTRETKDVLYQRFSRKPHLLLRLLACRTLDEWERTCRPYKLKHV